ncbi:hypothetical protein OG21DRAFT_1483041 [Imleria badia]|nr:hypothetical protein OG21DRAFT_1483041 [Imleria badia]
MAAVIPDVAGRDVAVDDGNGPLAVRSTSEADYHHYPARDTADEDKKGHKCHQACDAAKVDKEGHHKCHHARDTEEEDKKHKCHHTRDTADEDKNLKGHHKCNESGAPDA